MKKTLFAALATFMLLTLNGCGSDSNNGPPLFETTILSNRGYDGDIQLDRDFGFTITQGTNSVLAGLDPIQPVEYRSFLDFHLTGTNGVPGDAIIDSAYLDIFINNIVTEFSYDTIPLRIDLVSFQPPDLIESYFNRLALASIVVNRPISYADSGGYVTIDVTDLMVEAQYLGHSDFQVRFMEDLVFVAPGLIEINDDTHAPQLTVTYF